MAKASSNKSSTSKRKYLFDSVFSQTQLSNHYLVQLIFATIITTLGLITDNIVVVIGAMLLSPLFWPVMGISLGIITTRKHILKDAAVSFLASLGIVLLTSTLITLVMPINELSPEVTARVNPTIIDLFIALSVSTIGVFALYYPTISATAAGVAISISLLPPLVIVGMGLANLNGPVIWRALLLFGTNAGAIVFMGVIALYVLNIRPRKAEEEVRFRYGVLISGLLMVLLSIPLSIYLKESISQNIISSEINTAINEEIKEINKNARVERLNIDFLSLRPDTPLSVEATIYLPEGVFMTQSKREELVNEISYISKKQVNLTFNVVSTLSLQTEEDRQKSQYRTKIRQIVNREIGIYPEDIIIDNVEITFRAGENDDEKLQADIVIQIKQFGRSPLNYKDLNNLKTEIETETDLTANIEIVLIPINRLEETAVDVGVYEAIETGTVEILQDISDEIYVEELSIKEDFVFVKIFAPTGVYISPTARDEIELLISETLEEEVRLSLQIVRFESP